MSPLIGRYLTTISTLGHFQVSFHARTIGTSSMSRMPTQERAGDISHAFASLSGKAFVPLEPRYATLKKKLIKGREDLIRTSWDRLLHDLQIEVSHIAEMGSQLVPEVQYSDIAHGTVSEAFGIELRKRGVAVVRGVIDEKTALGYKEDIRAYVRRNPHTKGALMQLLLSM
jgi:hypothetical protein